VEVLEVILPRAAHAQRIAGSVGHSVTGVAMESRPRSGVKGAGRASGSRSRIRRFYRKCGLRDDVLERSGASGADTVAALNGYWIAVARTIRRRPKASQ